LVLVLEDGQIVDQGTHLELMARSGRYRELYDLGADDNVPSEGPTGAPGSRPAIAALNAAGRRNGNPAGRGAAQRTDTGTDAQHHEHEHLHGTQRAARSGL